MAKITIYYNNECSKSRDCLLLLSDKAKDIEVVNYLENPPTEEELKNLLKMLGIKAMELVRTKEPLFEEEFAGKELSEEQWITALVQNPVLIERPIVVKDGKAIIARPPEKVLEFL